MVPIIHCHGFELTEAIRNAVEARKEKVDNRIGLIAMTVNMEKQSGELYRVHFDCVTAHDGCFNSTAKGADLYALINEACEKLLRQLGDSSARNSGRNDRTHLNDHLDAETLM